jgi:hypothetical protein
MLFGAVGVSSPSSIKNSLDSNQTVNINLNELDSYRAAVITAMAQIRKDLTIAVNSGDLEKSKELNQSLSKAVKEFNSLNDIVVRLANETKALGKGFNLSSIQDVTLRRGEKGLEVPEARLLSGETLASAQQNKKDIQNRIDSVKRFENAPFNPFDSIKTAASKRIYGNKEFQNFSSAQADNLQNEKDFRSGLISDETYKSRKSSFQASKTNLLDRLNQEEEKIKKELIAVEKKRILSLGLGISKQEAANIAQENVTKSLLLGSKVWIDSNGKTVGLAAKAIAACSLENT